MSINKRLKQYRKFKGWSQVDLGKILELTQSIISNFENEKETATTLLINLYNHPDCQDLNWDWLMRGEGDMLRKKEVPPSQLAAWVELLQSYGFTEIEHIKTLLELMRQIRGDFPSISA